VRATKKVATVSDYSADAEKSRLNWLDSGWWTRS
jgi:hypothetical protein